MGLADIEVLMNSIPAKKELLRKSFEELQCCSSSPASFTFQWKDIDEHISSIISSIGQRFQELKALDPRLELEKPATPPAVICKEDQHEPDLKSICINMDANALRSYIIRTRKDDLEIRRELAPPLLFAPDPATLVLDLLDGFAHIEQQTAGGSAHTVRRTCFTLLESLHQMALDINPLHKARARQLALECKGLISSRQIQNAVIVLLLLQLIVTFGLVELFQFDDVVDLLVIVAERKRTVDLCMNSVLREMVPDLIEKLNSMGKQVDSIKFVIAFNLNAKYPPGHLLHAYVNGSKWSAADRGGVTQHNYHISKREDIKKEISALKKAIKAVEEYNLHHVYHPHSLREQIKELRMLMTENWRSSRSKELNSNITRKMRRQLERTKKQQLLSSNF